MSFSKAEQDESAPLLTQSNDFLASDKKELPALAEYLHYRCFIIVPEMPTAIIRVVLFLTLFSFWIIAFIDGDSIDAKEPVYLTKWGLIMDWLVLLVLSFLSVANLTGLIKESTNNEKPWVRTFCSSVECLQFISFSTNLAIVIFYWSFIHRDRDDEPAENFSCMQRKGYINVLNHAVAPALLACEFFFNHVPVRKRWCIALLIFSVFYLTCNAIVSLTFEIVYAPLSWRDWLTPLLALGTIGLAFIGVGVMFLFRWVIQSPIVAKN